MINLKQCKEIFLNHLDQYEDKSTIGFDFKLGIEVDPTCSISNKISLSTSFSTFSSSKDYMNYLIYYQYFHNLNNNRHQK